MTEWFKSNPELSIEGLMIGRDVTVRVMPARDTAQDFKNQQRIVERVRMRPGQVSDLKTD